MGANRNYTQTHRYTVISLADGGMGANRNEIRELLSGMASLADGGMGANRNGAGGWVQFRRA